jgi:hypothetical protein
MGPVNTIKEPVVPEIAYEDVGAVCCSGEPEVIPNARRMQMATAELEAPPLPTGFHVPFPDISCD